MSDEKPRPEPTDEFVARTKELGRDAKRVADDLHGIYTTATERVDLGRVYRDNPWLVLGAAAGVGYVLGGGLFTPLTARLLRLGTRALLVPLVSSQVKRALPIDDDQ
jgi:hypothetical protein